MQTIAKVWRIEKEPPMPTPRINVKTMCNIWEYEAYQKWWKDSNKPHQPSDFYYLITDFNGKYLYRADDYWEATCWAKQYNIHLKPCFRRANYYQGQQLAAAKAHKPYKPTHPATSEPDALSRGRLNDWTHDPASERAYADMNYGQYTLTIH